MNKSQLYTRILELQRADDELVTVEWGNYDPREALRMHDTPGRWGLTQFTYLAPKTRNLQLGDHARLGNTIATVVGFPTADTNPGQLRRLDGRGVWQQR